MKIFKVGFKSDYIYSVNMIWANTGKEEEEAVKETAERRAARYGYEVAFITEITESEAQSNINKGMPYYSIDEQAEAGHDPSMSEDEPEPTAAEIIDNVHTKVWQERPRSAWGKGVLLYALDLLDDLKEYAINGWINADDLSNRRLFERTMLNGAGSWAQYSEGGCSLIYNEDIAERLCAPWELRKTENGRKEPNPSESWIDVQSRALFQAAQMILNAAFGRGC